VPDRTIELETGAGSMTLLVADEGEGRPLLLLHGIPDTAAVWRGVVDALRGEARCVAPNLPHSGRGVVPRGVTYSLESMAALVTQLVDRLDLGPQIDLVVHDAGAFYGLSWAIQNPDRVRALTILNTLYHADYGWHFWARVCRAPVIGELGMAMLNRPLFAWEMRRGSSAIPCEYIRDAYEATNPAMKARVLELYRALPPTAFDHWEDRLRELTQYVPSQVLWGDRDPYVPRTFADRFGCEVVRFPNAGHWLQVEHPEAVAEAIARHHGLA